MKPQPLNAAYDDSPDEYDRLRRCWLNDRRFLFLAQLLRPEATGRIRNVLEIGSGTGWLLLRLAAMFPEISFWGVEPLVKYRDFAQARSTAPNLHFLAGAAEGVDALALPPMDAVLSNDVLHHVSRLDQAVSAVSKVAGAGCVWHAIEPNWLNAYSFFRQATTPGERVFWPRQFSGLARQRQWQHRETAHLFLVPPFVRDAPGWLKALEEKVEWVPFLAGGVYLRFEFRGPGRERTSLPG